MGMFTEEPLFDDPNLPTGWSRKVVQRQTGATAGQWDVYVYNPDGKKFRSRNELRSYFTQSGSQLNSEDFDFSVKGKGHHNKGKSPTKKEPESSKENLRAIRKPPTPVVSKRNTPIRPSPPPTVTSERPKRELRKKLKLEEIEEKIIEPEPEELLEDVDDVPEVSNVKLKVKVGYTATGAMIRPATNGRKKKRRFRNMTVKKKPKTIAKPVAAPTKRASPIAVKEVATPVKPIAIKEEKKVDCRTRSTSVTKKPRSGSKSATEPVAGPSGLQKIKRSPRRVLKRCKVAGDAAEGSEEDDDEDLDYVCSLYPTSASEMGSESVNENGNDNGNKAENQPQPICSADEAKSVQEKATRQVEKPLHRVSHKTNKEGLNGSKEELENSANSQLSPPQDAALNGLTNQTGVNCDEVGPMNVMQQENHIQQDDAMDQIGEEQMQVVVIGDSVEASHSYAKPHSL